MERKYKKIKKRYKMKKDFPHIFLIPTPFPPLLIDNNFCVVLTSGL